MDALATLLTALVASPKQHERLLRVHTPLGADVLVAETVHGVESVDAGGFRLELTALSVDAGLDLDALLGAPLLLELQTAGSIDAPRPFHGHITSVACVGSNGGVARYALVVEPWLAFLRQRVDSYVFHDMTVVDIVEDLFADYMPDNSRDAGTVVPAWRWELADRSVYRTRSITTQYAESDFAFLERLLAEEGIALWFEHAGAPGDETLGSHTLVLGDHVDAFNDAGTVRFHRNDASETADGVQQWSVTRQWQAGTLARASWDYRSRGLRAVSAEGTSFGETVAEDSDTAGPYAYADAAHGELRARRQLEALQVDACTVEGAGSWRQQAPGTRFVLDDHPAYADADAGRFTCLRVEHDARNNLGAEIDEALERSLGQTDGPSLELPDALSGLTALKPRSHRERGWGEGASANAAARPPTAHYHNTFTAIPAITPYRPRTVDGHGLRLHPRPTVTGTQSAIVVSDGAPVQTDRDHRIKVQFAWQRGGASSSGRSHPGGDNAPASDAAWTWVRVATPWAGDNWGGVVIPRQGQEVLVAFLEGDIDRPVIVGAVYNGRGQVDAAHNQLGGGNAKATGNAAAWFDGNDHKAVFTGFKSQALKDSQSGSGGYQQLRLDDTPGEGRAQISTTQHQTTLTLGHLKGGDDNVRAAHRGFGAELSTQASGAVRAGQGMLLTTEPGTQQLSATSARAQLDESEQLLKSLSDTAKTQTAILPGDPDLLPVHESTKTLHESLDATQSGSPAGDGVGGGDGDAPGWSSPVLLASSPDGVMTVTPKDQVWVSGTQTSLIAGSDLNWTSQAETVIAAANGIVLYTHGSDAPAGKPQQTIGIALHAAQGGVSARAHKNLARVAAQTSITLASTQADIQIAAPSKHLLATAAGAYLKLEGGNIELGAPGKIEFKAGKKDLTGPKSANAQATAPKGDLKLCEFKTRGADAGGDGLVVIGG